MNTLLKGSWRTSLLGLFAIVLAVAKFAVAQLDGDPATVYPLADLSAAVITGWALLMARDNKVTSEEARGVPAPGPASKGGMLGILILSLICASPGCAKFAGQTERKYEGTNVLSEVTRFRGFTFLDSKANLTRAKSLQTDRTQSVGVDASAQESTGKTLIEVGGKLIEKIPVTVP